MLSSHLSGMKAKQLVQYFTHAFVTVLLIACMVLFQCEQAVFAQGDAFNSGSDGSDGALNLTTPGTVVFDPHAFNPPLDPDGDNVYHFSSITIGPGVTVTLSALYLSGPVYWLASGPVQIDGIVDLNGQDGHRGGNLVNIGTIFPSIPGAGGFGGGYGGPDPGNVPAHIGMGPGGGGLPTTNFNGSQAGYAVAMSNGPGGAAYGNDFLVPLIGGSGGSGSQYAYGGYGGGGGAGGGALLIASSTSLQINGAIRANGGNGGEGGVANPIYGGGGSGGAIHLLAPIIQGTGTLNAAGGQRQPCSSGCLASPGRIRLEAFQQSFAGSSDPAPIFATPFKVYLPNKHPIVRVVSVDNGAVPLVPTNNFTSPDVTINNNGTAVIAVEARDVPIGTTVTLVIIPENRPVQMVTSTPLVGTFQLSTATVSVTIPPGHSHMFVRSDWTP